MKNINIEKLGYTIGVIGVAITLLWIGLFKFTLFEAKAIEPLVVNHFGMNWLYSILSVQGVSNLIGISEIIIAIGLIVSFWNVKIGKIAGIASTIIFITTLSFLATTPGIWKMVDGFPVTEFFLVKDIPFLAISLLVWGKNHKKLKNKA